MFVHLRLQLNSYVTVADANVEAGHLAGYMESEHSGFPKEHMFWNGGLWQLDVISKESVSYILLLLKCCFIRGDRDEFHGELGNLDHPKQGMNGWFIAWWWAMDGACDSVTLPRHIGILMPEWHLGNCGNLQIGLQENWSMNSKTPPCRFSTRKAITNHWIYKDKIPYYSAKWWWVNKFRPKEPHLFVLNPFATQTFDTQSHGT